MKKYFLVFIIICFTSICYGKNLIYTSQGGYKYFDDGTYIAKNKERGKYEGKIENNKREGVWKLYNENGELESVYSYKNDNLIGTGKEYYESGNIKIIKKFSNNGKKMKVKEYYKNGKLKNEGNSLYVSDNNYVPEGKLRVFYENGKLKGELNFKNGKLDGENKTYYKNGKLKDVGNFKNDKIQGKTKAYFESGELMGANLAGVYYGDGFLGNKIEINKEGYLFQDLGRWGIQSTKIYVDGDVIYWVLELEDGVKNDPILRIVDKNTLKDFGLGTYIKK